ncbi:MAG TPA: glycerol-3-phosphate 1-O-acyltransferase PlsY [Syntrophomonadaceae bacterium]|nr:glycerol-3-phosphate 1-O-acyltransferase PlsY [Syntrophomonadaceae bacterium]
MKIAVLIILCYLIGSIPFSFIFSKLMGGVDIRKRGSHNVGATNVLRTSGLKVALPAFAGDLLKGFAAVWIGSSSGSTVIMALCGAAAVIGHCWPVFLGLKGGKGVATCGGIILYLSPAMFVALLTVFIFLVIATRYVSLGSICVAALFPVNALFFNQPRPLVLMSLFMAVLVVARHHQNIRNLINGTEAKFTEKATS